MKEKMTFRKMIRKVISGGQTGADKGGLLAAYENGIATGGVAPKGWKTEIGPDLTLLSKFNLIESESSDYTVRTLKNVRTSDCTIIFSDKKSKGSALTENYCRLNNKPFLLIKTEDLNEADYRTVFDFIAGIYTEKGRELFINVAGNRESKSPGIEKRVKEFISKLLLMY